MCRRDCDSEPWDWLLLSGSTARVQSLAYGPLLFRVLGRGRGLGIFSCHVGVGVGHTREIERIKEKMNIATEERKHGTKKEEGQVIMTERQ